MTFKAKRTGALIDAVRFDQAAVYARMGCVGMDLDTGVSFHAPSMPYVLTRDGRQYIADGDWILTHQDGGTEAVSPEDFAELVEPIVEAGAGR